MKIKSILVSGILVGSLAMVGCQSTEEVESVREPISIEMEDTAPVEDTEEVLPCRDCGNPIEDCTCVGWDCVYCGQWHTEDESYYNEDGMSACSEACFNAYTGQASEPTQGNCDPVVNVIESNNMPDQMPADCPHCGTQVHDYSHTEFRQSGSVFHIYNCSNCGSIFELLGRLN